VQLPTGSARNTSGFAVSVRCSAAAVRELNRQQKQPPVISSTAYPYEPTSVVSTRPEL
jgi:hypothetical protein